MLNRAHGFCVLARFQNIGDVQKGRALQANVDESRLHPRQNAHDPPDINITHQAPTRRSFNMQLLHDALIHNGDARFLRGEIDQNVFGESLKHEGCPKKCR